MKTIPSIFTLAIIIFLIWRSRRRSQNDSINSGNSFKKPDQKRDAAMIETEITAVTDEIDFFSTYKDHDVAHATDSILLHEDEHLLATVSVVGLIENKQTEDGASPVLLDEGEFIVTTARGVFVGKIMTHEFQWTKLISHKTEPLVNNLVMYLPVSNRQKIYGITADDDGIANVQKRLAFGVAVALGRQEQHIEGLKADREKLIKEKQQLVSGAAGGSGLEKVQS